MALINIFYAGDMKCKNTDVFIIEQSVVDRISKQMKENAKILTFLPGECISVTGRKRNIITYTQHINMDNVVKIIIDDMTY